MVTYYNKLDRSVQLENKHDTNFIKLFKTTTKKNLVQYFACQKN